MATQKPCTLTLQTEDGAKFEVEKNLAALSETIMKLVVEGGHDKDNDDILHIPSVTGPTMDRVIQLWKWHSMNLPTRVMSTYTILLAQPHREVEEVMEVVMAVNDLDCKELMDVTRIMVEEIEPRDAASYFNLRMNGPDDDSD